MLVGVGMFTQILMIVKQEHSTNKLFFQPCHLYIVLNLEFFRGLVNEDDLMQGTFLDPVIFPSSLK